ncbi:unnamed protein product [Musa textilis]
MDALLAADLAFLPSFSGDLFTPAELSAAAQLVQLRGSIRGESSAPQKPTFSPSLSSVGTRRKAPLQTETEEPCPRRRKKWRYRLVVDLYAATERVQAPPIAPPRKAVRVRSCGGRQGRCRRLRHPVQEEETEEEESVDDMKSAYALPINRPTPRSECVLHWFVLLLPVTDGSSPPTSRRRPQDRDPATFAIVVEVGPEEIYIVDRDNEDIGVIDAATGETQKNAEHSWSTGFKLITPAKHFATAASCTECPPV